ncbi:PREDICTED: protein SMAX1-LIKE 3-like [Nicotiana attenuata]|uniref:Protein smax1-like 3 n=1 Tax=Nicotiana attenuata TaxID=49451 RepID=A0A314LBR1_NICAT|nr:PREDICTED: protein SMAX1-LIKE 3-like [Nicotiana attenuata]OIT39012.1 protein smax1-like 3 [Nicotiana attenuata]
MRTGGYTFQQSLTPESASIVKQAVNLARRRGHAQVTPLHVASAMLSSSSGLLKRACLQSHSHPLQCKALELCFNVALNRLPTSVSSPILGPHSHLPSLSNALVAAFKRAQAHQRRGSIENQQQPILALKVEIEQLVISILDDPSISRVMREAGFSSPQVKNNVEQAVSSLEICSKEITTKPVLVLGNTNMSQITSSASVLNLSLSKSGYQVKNDDVMSVVETMMKRKNVVLIGECLATAEGVVRGVIDKFDKGEVSGDMKHVQFISVPLFTLRNISREEFEIKLRELRTLVKNYINRGVVLYLGDLRWVSEFWTKYGEQQRNMSYYSPVEHMIMELSRLLSGAIGENGRLWIIGIASFQTYIKCKSGHPSLQTLWDLYPLTIPVGSLALSLNLESDLHSHLRSKAAMDGSSWSLGRVGVEKQLTCCADCLANFKREAKTISSIQVKTESTTTYSSSSLPSWLQKYKEEHRQANNDQESEMNMVNLCKKWNSICNSVHKQQPHFLEKGFISPLSSPSPCSSNSISSSNDHHIKSSSKLHKSLLNWPVIFESNQSPKEHQFFTSENEAETKPELLSNPNSSPNSASSSEASGYMENIDRFNELNSDNMKILCKALEKKVPWQKDIIPEIVSTILECRSKKEETWLFFLGADFEGKEKISRELAKIVFGSEDSFISIGISSFSSSTRADSTEEVSNKRSRNEHGKSYLERFVESIQENPSRVFLLEDIEQVDSFCQKGIKKAIETGSFTLADGDLVSFKDAIFIFSSESFSSVSRACSPLKKCHDDQVKEIKDQENGDESVPSVLDLNIATEENGDENNLVSHDIGIWEAVDKQVIFKIQVL